MKKTSLILSLLLLTGSFGLVAQAAAPATSTQVKLDPNEQFEYGYQDGRDAAAGYAAQYGYGTQAYQDAITDAAADARYQALHSEGDLSAYFRGYGGGLRSY
jgi:hypothetical protein